MRFGNDHRGDGDGRGGFRLGNLNWLGYDDGENGLRQHNRLRNDNGQFRLRQYDGLGDNNRRKRQGSYVASSGTKSMMGMSMETGLPSMPSTETGFPATDPWGASMFTMICTNGRGLATATATRANKAIKVFIVYSWEQIKNKL